jgi:DNA polymerase-3 subunit gamma/tau
VYLVDEVHMLSKAAFNALLKTLEEPPEHVKFLLATTDPQKLPVTVLSRCLQFNLKRLDEDQIAGQLTMILGAEGIPADAAAVRGLSRAADGSLRDGLSLLDQAIAYAGGKLDEASVAAMLGSVDRARVGALLSALADGDGAALLREVGALAEFAPDWNDVLDALADALHRVQVRQLVPGADAGSEEAGVDVAGLAAALRPEVVQLWYQMALNARRDLPLAPAPRAGFEMAVLRMLAFRPLQDVAQAASAASSSPSSASGTGAGAGRGSPSAAAAARAALADAAAPASPAPRRASPEPRAAGAAAPMPAPATASPEPAPPPVPSPGPAAPRETAPATGRRLDAAGWLDVVADAGLTGPAKQLAAHVAFLGHEGNVLRLALPPGDELLKTPNSTRALAQALAPALGAEPQLRFEAVAVPAAAETLHQRDTRERSARQDAAESAFLADPGVQVLMQRHGATLVPDSIRPHDE